VSWLRWKLSACCWMPPFFAHYCNTKLPIAHPLSQLRRPFQYKIWFIACDTWGHYGTALALIFLQVFSVWCLYSVATWSIASYSICWDCESLLVTSFCRICAQVAIPLLCRCSQRIWLDMVITCRPLHSSCLAGDHLIALWSMGQMLCVGISIHMAQ